MTSIAFVARASKMHAADREKTHMSDLIDRPVTGENTPEFTVTELSGAIKRTIEGAFGHVRIRGEIGRVSRPRSGHIYLDLKDDRSVLAGVIWKGMTAGLHTLPEEGMEVIAEGRLTTFGGQSKYQIVIENITPAGIGALMAMLEKRKATLQAEGVFDPARKQPLPFLPEVIGVITSLSGAVIRDILHRLRDRFPRHVLIWPVTVQGETSALEVTRAIQGFNALVPGGALPRPDLLIVARGGGSVEDLWGFNEASVARAAAESRIPLISAVGHETDTTLIDLAADIRAPTPTAAAELAVPVRLELLAAVDQLHARLSQARTRSADQYRQRIHDLGRALPRPETLIRPAEQRLDNAVARLPVALRSVTQARRIRLTEATGGLRPRLLWQTVYAARNRLDRHADRLDPALQISASKYRLRFEGAAARIRPDALQAGTMRARDHLEGVAQRLRHVMQNRVSRWKSDLVTLDRMYQSLGYEQTLKRGYAVVRAGETILTTAKAAKAAGQIEVQFADGRVSATAGQRRSAAEARTVSREPPEQGSLF